MTTSRWKGKRALITGATSGIGRAVAVELASAGLDVAITGRREDRLVALAGDIREAHDVDVFARPCDLRNTEDITAFFAALREHGDGVDVMINNAGLGRLSPLMSGETERWREMLEVNVLALCVCTREALSDMRRRGDRGHVIHIASMASHRVPTGSGVYSATKFAVRSLTEGLRLELREAGSDIRVTAISPGFVETEFALVYSGDEARAKAAYSRFPVLQPEDIASAVRHVLDAPDHVQVHDMLIRPTRQPT